jgi:hypothetical protein
VTTNTAETSPNEILVYLLGYRHETTVESANRTAKAITTRPSIKRVRHDSILMSSGPSLDETAKGCCLNHSLGQTDFDRRAADASVTRQTSSYLLAPS